MTELVASEINLISKETKLEGKVHFKHDTRVYGVIVGDITSEKNAEICIAENGMVEGNIKADILYVDGFVKGDINADTKVFISSTGKVIGNIETPKLDIDFGAHFEGKTIMETLRPSLSPSPAEA